MHDFQNSPLFQSRCPISEEEAGVQRKVSHLQAQKAKPAVCLSRVESFNKEHPLPVVTSKTDHQAAT